ncbi:MAG: hypothetical protein EXR64_02975 [Dehalococcoidia bacterium]|nr:hypothetical protein [Dehalococcoidia bacterium]
MAADTPGPALAAALPVNRASDVTTPASLSGLPHPTAEDTVRALFAVPVREQPFEASRIETPLPGPATTAPDALVRATRVTPGAGGTPSLAAGDRLSVSVSFYYCEAGGQTPARGDGGGFCGAMRDGSVVYNGAAACDHAYLGQHFRIEGDPLKRIYRCADTGSAVHGLHRDIWFHTSGDGWAWQRSVGEAATIEILP